MQCSGTLAAKSADYTPMLVKLLGEIIASPCDLAAPLEEVEVDLGQSDTGVSSSQALALPAPTMEQASPQDDNDITLEPSDDVYLEDVPAPLVWDSPVAPSPKESARHNLVHVPFQPWCGLRQRC